MNLFLTVEKPAQKADIYLFPQNGQPFLFNKKSLKTVPCG
ncbi:hypothetical protein HOLDEFILI_03943 [Holdemania filiformis DSM 12042]|uniref:Uncharacterized protein n=1 Tax=Holdemania filiformis DSM 12042 TaxID=545696 RepID=B9YDM0_9FIRM|nr:hypothetical protein HOLDEFILI_03943 [Holdemania filiformis DSM 12042]